MALVGVIAFIVALLIFKRIFFPGSPEDRAKEKEEYNKRHDLDEELEDYDYLDDITGKDDKPWI